MEEMNVLIDETVNDQQTIAPARSKRIKGKKGWTHSDSGPSDAQRFHELGHPWFR